MANPENSSTRSVVLNTISIIPSDGIAYSIKEIVNNINIYEDIFSPVTTGQIEIIDSVGMLAAYQFHGNEYLTISFNRPGENEPDKKYERSFRIFKVSDRTPGSGLDQKYVMHFCSEEQIFSNSQTLSRSYRGKIISEYVTAICKQDLKIQRIGEIEKTIGIQDIIIPRMTPLQSLNLLAANSFNDIESPYLFFENRIGFNFVSLSTLFNLAPITTLTYSTAKMTRTTEEAAYQNSTEIATFNVAKSFDIWAATKNLTFAGRLFTLDILRQKYVKQDYNLKKVNENNFIDKGNMIINNAKNRNEKPLYEEYESNICYSITNHNQSNAPYLLSKAYRVTDTNVENTLMQRQALLNNLKSVVIDSCAVAGNPDFSVGFTVHVVMPAFSPNEEDKRNIDPYLSGKYLITAVRHNITKSGGLQTFLSLAKNSYYSPLNNVDSATPLYKVTRNK